MRLHATAFLLALVASSVGCTSTLRESRKSDPAQRPAQADEERAVTAQPMQASRGIGPVLEKSGGGGGGGRGQHIASVSPVHSDSITDDASAVSLASISTVYAAEAIDRKIIRNGELTLETESPTEGLRKITAAAESHGGFVVTSEFKQNPVSPGDKAKPKCNSGRARSLFTICRGAGADSQLRRPCCPGEGERTGCLGRIPRCRGAITKQEGPRRPVSRNYEASAKGPGCPRCANSTRRCPY